jgi:hypothetical protein
MEARVSSHKSALHICAAFIAVPVLAAACLGALAAWTPAHAAGALTVENPLQECMAARTGLRSVEHGISLQHITLDVKKPIGDCGCKSAVVSYVSWIVLEGAHRTPLLQGRLGVRQSGPRTLPLASDATLIGDRPLVLSFDCMAPD